MSFFGNRLIVGLLLLVASAAPSFAVTVKEVKSPKGLTAYLSEDHTAPVIAITFGFRGGSSLDPDAKLGLSNLAASTLDEGAGDLDSFAFQSALEDRAITLRYAAGDDDISGSLVTTAPNAQKAFELLHLSLTKPRFDTEPVERIRRQIMVGIQSRTENPNFIARQQLYKTMFGTHPYGRDDEGTLATVKSITADDLRAWVKSRFARDRLIIAASGDITAADLGKAMDMIFGDLPATSGLKVALAPATVNPKAQIVRVTKNLPQSVIYIGQKGIMRADPDWYAALLVDYVFGSGSFSSRLMDEVREKRGLAYGVSTSLAPYDAGAAMLCSVATRADQAENSLNIIRAEWKKIRDEGPTETELQGAKDYMIGAWPLRFTSTKSIADTLFSVQRDHLGIDYIDKRNSMLQAVTLDQAKKVARTLYDPDNLNVVVVGPTPKASPAK